MCAGEHRDKFASSHLTGDQFLNLNQNQLKDYGVASIGDRKKLAKALSTLKDNLL